MGRLLVAAGAVADPAAVHRVLRADHLQVGRLAERLKERRLELDVTDEALDWLAKQGYDEAYGARPLRRLVQTAIGDRLAKEILAGSVRDGDTIRVDTAGDGLSVGPVR